jgi:hypothetical protein
MAQLGLVTDQALLVLFIVYFLSASTTVIATVKTTWSDPTDPTVSFERKTRKLPLEEAKKVFNKGDYEYFCSVCAAHVIEDSKHCRKCNRCTLKFDHHCNIVNNDIGKLNYKLFATMIGSANIFLTLHMSLSAYSLSILYRSLSAELIPEVTDTQLEWKSSIGLQIGFVSAYVGVILCFVAMFPLGHLTVFHLYLTYKGITTFQYVKMIENRAESRVVTKVNSITPKPSI